MKISNRGLKLIQQFEGFSSHPYLCPALVPTIGYGSTHYSDGRPVKLTDKNITKEEATDMMRHQIDIHYGKEVNHFLRHSVTQNQFDVLVSFAYNFGVYALRTSTLLRDVNHGKMSLAADQFKHWTHVNGKVNRGLVARRKKERELFLA